MNYKNTNDEVSFNQAQPLDFGLVIEKSFENFKKIALLGGLGILLLVMLIFGAAFVAVAAFMGAAENLTETLTDFNFADLSIVGILIYVSVSIIFAGLAAPIGAGFLKMAHLAHENKPFSIGTIFDYYKTHYFKELFIAGSLISIVTVGTTTFFELIDLSYLGTIITYIIAYFTVISVPLIIFGNQTAINSISLSFKLVAQQPFIFLGLLAIGIIGILVGLVGLCIGIFFTMPFWYSLIYTIYTNLYPINETSEIEEIGESFE